MRITAAVDRARERIGIVLSPRRALARRAELGRLHAGLDAGRFDALRAEGSTWALEDAARHACAAAARIG